MDASIEAKRPAATPSATAATPATAAGAKGAGAGSPSKTYVRDIMQKKIVTISAGDTLSTLEDIMTLGRVRHMPVVHRGVLVGVVSERDLLRASLSNLTEFGTEQRRAFLQVVEITRVMSAPPIVIAPDRTVEQAARVLADRKIGCLPVLEGQKLVGLVTETDVLRYFAGALPPAPPG